MKEGNFRANVENSGDLQCLMTKKENVFALPLSLTVSLLSSPITLVVLHKKYIFYFPLQNKVNMEDKFTVRLVNKHIRSWVLD